MSFKIEKPVTVPARGGINLQQPVEKLNLAVQSLGRVQGDPMQSAVRLGEMFDAGLLRYDATGLLIPGPAVGGSGASALTFKNHIINGDYRWWQRGTSAGTATGVRYLADRWQLSSSGDTLSSNRQVFDIGQTAVPGNPIFFQRISVDAVVADPLSYAVYIQRIENVRRFAGKRLTISWWAKALAPREMSLEWILYYGTGGAPSENLIAPKKHSVTTSWQKFTQTVIIPSMVGKAHDGGNSSLLVHFWLASGSDPAFQVRNAGLGNATGIIDIACVQVEEGSVATPFEFLPPDVTLAQCQRYYEKSYNVNDNPGTVTTSGSVSTIALGLPVAVYAGCINVGFCVKKRASPALTFYSPQTGASGVIRDGANAVDVAPSAVFFGENGFAVQAVNAAANNQYVFRAHYTADADL